MWRHIRAKAEQPEIVEVPQVDEIDSICSDLGGGGALTVNQGQMNRWSSAMFVVPARREGLRPLHSHSCLVVLVADAN